MKFKYLINMKDFRNLLTIKPKKAGKKTNILEVWMKWDSNDADYIEQTIKMNPEVLFDNKKLIYCLAYITLLYDFKGHDWNDAAFKHHVSDNCDIDNLIEVLVENDFMIYTDWVIVILVKI